MIPINEMSIEGDVATAIAEAEAEAEEIRSKAISKFIEHIDENVCRQDDFFVYFANNKFTETEITNICKALDSNNQITCFTLASGEAHKKHIPLICQQLKTNKTITTINFSGIDLRHNSLEETNVLKEIVRLLGVNNNITSLVLSNTNIHNDKSPLLEEQSVSLLHFLITSTKTLLNLEIDGNNFSELSLNRIINALAKNSSLETLNLANIKAMNGKLTQGLAAVNPKIKVKLKHASQDFERKQELEHKQASELKQEFERKQELEENHVLESTLELERKQIFEQVSESGPESSSEVEVRIPIKPSLPQDHVDFSKLLDKKALISAIRNRQCSQDNFTAAFQRLVFEGEELKDLFEALNTNPEIHTLDFQFDETITIKYDKQFKTLCALLKTNTTIKNLILFPFILGKAEIEMLVQMLKFNKCIISLNLACSLQCTENPAVYVREILLTNKKLTSLNVGRLPSSFERPDFKMILNGLSHNKTLQEISFESAHKLKGLMQELLEVFGDHPSITSIDLHRCYFTLDDMVMLSSVLLNNSRIKCLNLSEMPNGNSYNKPLPPEGYQILSEAIAASKTLEYFAMNLMEIPVQILYALTQNRSLRRLECHADVEKETLLKILKQHPTLESVKLPRIFSVNDMFNDLDEVCKVNKRIREFIMNRGYISGSEKQPYDEWYERLLKFLKEHPQITSINVYYSDEMRNRYYKRIETQLYENRNRTHDINLEQSKEFDNNDKNKDNADIDLSSISNSRKVRV